MKPSEKFKKAIWAYVTVMSGRIQTTEDVNLEPMKVRIAAATTLAEVVAALEGTVFSNEYIVEAMFNSMSFLGMSDFVQSLEGDFTTPFTEEPPFTVSTEIVPPKPAKKKKSS